uniref:Uncharacterized protein LOC111135366 isoform X3 n=1 Tax=Crassostrea virginica TaxID=6565 RepID=A0A8B8EME8_CRAVI|nr:uncharacterized protein LOC111135366 isoform X3 [Crassostrea virginica]
MNMVVRWCLMLISLVHQSVNSQRLVVNTTCLELAKSSNQQLRLSCDNPDNYHCLIDGSNTREYEVCRVWKWISKGDCAYFNLFGEGNIDRKDCKPSENMICSPKEYPSYENTKYTACYIKRNTNTDGQMETSSSSHVSPSVTSLTSDWMNKSLPHSSTDIDKTTHKQMQVLAIIFGVLVPFLTLCGIYFVFRHFKCLLHSKDDIERNSAEKDAALPKEQAPLLSDENKSDEETTGHSELSGNAQMSEVSIEKSGESNAKETKETVEYTSGNLDHTGNVQTETNNESYIGGEEEFYDSQGYPSYTKETNPATQFQNCDESKQNDANMLKLNNSEEDTSGHSELSGNVQKNEESIEKSEESKENKTAAETNNDSYSGDEGEFYDTHESTVTTPVTTPVGSPMILDSRGEQGSLIEPNSQTEQTGNDVKGEKEHSNENDSHYDYISVYESTEVFDDTIESLQREVTTEIDEQEGKHCHQLFDLLYNEGLDLCREVLRLVITRTAGKTPTELLADEAVTNKLKTILPQNCHRILLSQTERETSIDVLYGLIRLCSGKQPKSGWGNPVKGNDTEISDDVERLHRSFHICKEITNPVALSVNNYARLCGIMSKALTRLDSEGKLKDKYKVLAYKLKAIINPNWSQSVYRILDNVVIRWSHSNNRH